LRPPLKVDVQQYYTTDVPERIDRETETCGLSQQVGSSFPSRSPYHTRPAPPILRSCRVRGRPLATPAIGSAHSRAARPSGLALHTHCARVWVRAILGGCARHVLLDPRVFAGFHARVRFDQIQWRATDASRQAASFEAGQAACCHWDRCFSFSLPVKTIPIAPTSHRPLLRSKPAAGNTSIRARELIPVRESPLEAAGDSRRAPPTRA
jgi:hypothetical protein